MNHQKLINWSKKHYSHLPWRQNRSLYSTLVSEIMLQQTTVGTVLNHFDRFLKRFPDLPSLAEATEEELLIEWKGLGYYRRARSLKKISEQIANFHAGKFPKNEADLLNLKGVGPYTANAILAIGMNQKAIAVDANIERVLSRVYGINTQKGPKLTKEIYQSFLDKKILSFDDKVSFRDLNEALMDLGRVYCKANTVECQNCPIQNECIALKKRNQLKFPLQEKTQIKEKHEIELLRIIVRNKNSFLAYQKNDQEWLAGQWEVPTFLIQSTDDTLLQYPKLNKVLKLDQLPSFNTTITKYKIKNYILIMTMAEFEKKYKANNYSWRVSNSNSNFTTATTKAFRKLEIKF